MPGLGPARPCAQAAVGPDRPRPPAAAAAETRAGDDGRHGAQPEADIDSVAAKLNL